jgi:hypothetical protein
MLPAENSNRVHRGEGFVSFDDCQLGERVPAALLHCGTTRRHRIMVALRRVGARTVRRLIRSAAGRTGTSSNRTHRRY